MAERTPVWLKITRIRQKRFKKVKFKRSRWAIWGRSRRWSWVWRHVKVNLGFSIRWRLLIAWITSRKRKIPKLMSRIWKFKWMQRESVKRSRRSRRRNWKGSKQISLRGFKNTRKLCLILMKRLTIYKRSMSGTRACRFKNRTQLMTLKQPKIRKNWTRKIKGLKKLKFSRRNRNS